MSEKNCIDCIKTRQSIRKFKDEKISSAAIDEIIEAGLKAPSAGNKQPWRIVKTSDEEQIQKLAEAAYGQSVMKNAKAVLVVVAVPSESAERYGERGRSLYVLQDTAALTYALLLAAHAKGLGACWVGAFDEDTVADEISAPQGFRPVSMIPMGVPDEKPNLRPRKSAEFVVKKDTFGNDKSVV